MKQLYLAKSSKAQMKIQEMAFVLIAIMVLFGLVALLYFSIRISGINKSASDLGELHAKEAVRKLSSSPELSGPDCDNCIDFDKVLIIKERSTYRDFWGLDYLKIERIYPDYSGECNKFNYPECKSVTIIDKENIGTPSWAFVSLCRNEAGNGGYIKCELGKIYASGSGVNDE